jgi:hypothetical protein
MENISIRNRARKILSGVASNAEIGVPGENR